MPCCDGDESCWCRYEVEKEAAKSIADSLRSDAAVNERLSRTAPGESALVMVARARALREAAGKIERGYNFGTPVAAAESVLVNGKGGAA